MLNAKQKTPAERMGFCSLLSLISIAIILLSLFACVFLWLSKNTEITPETLGQFGDFFGGLLNPILSVFSLFLIARSFIYTLRAFNLSMEANNLASEQVNVALRQFIFEQEKYIRDFKENERRTRQDLTIAWHHNWMSPQMATLKRNAYGEIETRISSIGRGQHSAFIGGFRTSDRVEVRERYHAIKDVMLLIHHAVTFFDDGLLDKDLFLKLFAADFRQWHSVLSRLDMRIDTSDGSQDSLLEETERRDLVKRLARVIGLQETSVAS
jgi:hypothetical protein